MTEPYDCENCEHYVRITDGRTAKDRICIFDGECENLPMTNEEYIQSLTTEEKAEWLAKTFNTHPCGYLLECNHCNLTSRCSEDVYPTNAETWVEWLKEIHRG